MTLVSWSGFSWRAGSLQGQPPKEDIAVIWVPSCSWACLLQEGQPQRGVPGCCPSMAPQQTCFFCGSTVPPTGQRDPRARVTCLIIQPVSSSHDSLKQGGLEQRKVLYCAQANQSRNLETETVLSLELVVCSARGGSSSPSSTY